MIALRVALTCLALASCYQPAAQVAPCTIRCEEGCPGDLECIGGMCGGCDGRDGGADTPSVDCELGPFATASQLGLRTAPITAWIPARASYTTGGGGPAGPYAAFQVNASDINWGAPDGPLADLMLRGTSNATVFRAPHIAPDRDEVFVQTHLVMPDRHEMRVSTRTSDAWSDPATVVFRDALGGVVAMQPDDLPSTPTVPDPQGRRHMMLELDGTLVEHVEVAATANWMEITTLSHDHFGLQDVQAPQLSADGRTLTFLGSDGVGYAIYASRRDTFMDAFSGAPVKLYSDGTSELPYNPFLSADCRTLYFTQYTPGIMKAVR